MSDRNTSVFAGFVFALVVLTAGLGVAFAAGGASAQTSTVELASGSADATNETESLYVDVVGNSSMGGAGPVDVNVTVIGLESGQDVANGTEVDSMTLSVAEGATESYDYVLTDTDVSSYDTLEIVVETDGDETLIESVDWGSLVDNPGGAGGGLLDGSGVSVPVILGLLVVGYIVMGRE